MSLASITNCFRCGTPLDTGMRCPVGCDAPFGPYVKNLTPGEETSLEKIALLRGHIGRLRGAIYMAHDLLHRKSIRPEGFLSEAEKDVDAILMQALELEAP